MSFAKWVICFTTRQYRMLLPERQIYIRSAGGVRFFILHPALQLFMAFVLLVFTGWLIAALITFYSYSMQIASRDLELLEIEKIYSQRIEEYETYYKILENERDVSESKFVKAMEELDKQYGNDTGSRADEIAIQSRLKAVVLRMTEISSQRDDAMKKLATLQDDYWVIKDQLQETSNDKIQLRSMVENLNQVVSDMSSERDKLSNSEKQLRKHNIEIAYELEELRKHQSAIMVQIEEAVVDSLTEVSGIMKRTGVNVDVLLKAIQSKYEGIGGPFIPAGERQGSLPMSLVDTPMSANRLLDIYSKLDRIDHMRLAISSLPLGSPFGHGVYARRTSSFGYRRDPFNGKKTFHRGVDYAAAHGTQLFAASSGKVVFSGRNGSFGNVIKVKHDLGFGTLYAHLNDIHVSKGDTIERGQLLGTVGSTGRSTGSHLHYEVHFRGKALDPQGFITAGNYVVF